MDKKLNIQVPRLLIRSFSPDDYILHEELKNAIEVAIALNQPLLLTGEPGTGKTKLAFKIAHELAKDNSMGYKFKNKPLIFYTKTTSNARDLFYTYDALSHFQEANLKREVGQGAPPTANFIELQALGKAIAETNPSNVDVSKFKTELSPSPVSSVVLIDEIDKAPRDFTNDILNEIENYHFQIREQDSYAVDRDDNQRIVVIMTSNSEKNLPDAFLRRCVFYNIPFPNKKLLLKIVQKQLGSETKFTEKLLDELIDKFNEIREKAVRKPPATAELIAWLRILEMQDFMEKGAEGRKAQLLNNLSILVKTQEDLEAIKGIF